jgi:hypothetical protein
MPHLRLKCKDMRIAMSLVCELSGPIHK